MDPTHTAEENAFRDEVRGFLRDHLPAPLAAKVRDGKRMVKEDMQQWHAILESRHWLANHWPVEHGGPGWSVVERYIFDVETALAHAPRIVPFGVSMLGPDAPHRRRSTRSAASARLSSRSTSSFTAGSG